MFSLAAQGFYFDGGIGAGWAWSNLGGTYVNDLFTDVVELPELAVDFISVKLGYGPIAKKPIYIVGIIDYMFHGIYSSDRQNSLKIEYPTIGIGAIFYPVPIFQLAGSIGMTSGFISFSGPYFDYLQFENSDNAGQEVWGRGLLLDFSAAVDLGKRNHGCLLGLKYTGVFLPSLKDLGDSFNTQLLSIFAKYTYRRKI